MSKEWSGEPPQTCDVCGGKMTGGEFVDGKTRMGPWAIMCRSCHRRVGAGLGTGKGQKYRRQPGTDSWVKVAG